MAEQTSSWDNLFALANAADFVYEKEKRLKELNKEKFKEFPCLPRLTPAWSRELVSRAPSDPNAASSSTPSIRSLPYKKVPMRRTCSQPGWIESTARGLCTVPVILGEKTMYATDLSVHANRFRFTDEMMEALTRDDGVEQPLLCEGRARSLADAAKTSSDKEKNLPVLLFDPQDLPYEVDFSFWPSNRWFILHGSNYARFVANCQIKPKTKVTVSAFHRIDLSPAQSPNRPTLCFAISPSVPAEEMKRQS